MKVRLYKPVTYIGIYQIVDILQKFGVSDEKCFKIANKIKDKYPKICAKIADFTYKIRHKKDKIVIENFDVWSADHTLSLIIVPVLKKLKEQKHGSPFIDNEDVPEEFRTNDSDPNNIDDDAFQARWEWALDRMIQGFAFVLEEDVLDISLEAAKAKAEYAAEGRRLFAKYYQGLWD